MMHSYTLGDEVMLVCDQQDIKQGLKSRTKTKEKNLTKTEHKK